jgi:gluconolactonase
VRHRTVASVALVALVLGPLAVACSNNKASSSASGSNETQSGTAPQGGTGQSTAQSGAGSGLGQPGSGVTSGSGLGSAGGSTGSESAGASSGNAATGFASAAGSLEAGSGANALEAGQPEGSVGAGARFVCPAGPFPTPVASAAEAVCGDFAFKYDWNEGPTWIASQQAFFFSNFVRGTSGPGDIIKYTPGGACETWLTDVGCNGLTAAADGTLVGVCQTPRAVMAYDVTTKQPKTLASMYMGQLLDSPNDVASISNGSIYFSNPTYELGPRPVGVGPAFFYIDPTGALNLIIKDANGQPNGVAVSPDEKRLYLEFDGSGVKTYDLDANGVPSNGPKSFAGTTDGMSVDCAGNLYLSGGSIIAPSGTQVGSYPGGTMAAFGGADGKTIIVVGGGTELHTVQMNVPGPPH